MSVKRVIVAIIMMLSWHALGDKLSFWEFEDDSIGQNLTNSYSAKFILVRGPSTSTFMDCSFTTGYEGQGLSFASNQVAAFSGSYDTPASQLVSEDFKVEAYINPGVQLADGEYSTLICAVDYNDPSLLSYELGLVGTNSEMHLQCMFSNTNGTETFSATFDGAAVPVGSWSSVGAWFDSEAMELTLSLNDGSESYISTIAPAGDAGSGTYLALGKRRAGGGWAAGTDYVGLMDNLKVGTAVEQGNASWTCEDISTQQMIHDVDGEVPVQNLVLGTSTTTFKDCAFTASGYSGQGLEFAGDQVAAFDAGGDYHRESSKLALESFQIEAYINPDSSLADGAVQTLICNSDMDLAVFSYDLSLIGTNSATRLQCMFSNLNGTETFTAVFAGAAVPAGSWSYVAAWFDESTMTLSLQVGDDVETFVSPIVPAGDAWTGTYFSLGLRRTTSGWVSGTDYYGRMDEIKVGPYVPVLLDEIGMTLDGAKVIVGWEAYSLSSYALQRKLDLTAGSWSNVVTGIEGIDGMQYATNSTDEAHAFYRVVVE